RAMTPAQAWTPTGPGVGPKALPVRPGCGADDREATTSRSFAGGTGLSRHAADAGGSEAGQVKAMEQVIQWGELDLDLVRLSTMPAKGKSYDQDRTPRPIDHRDLSVRHLGSLYEGLLEYNLFVVEGEQRVVRASKKRTQYVPYSQAGKVHSKETILEVGDVYFSETAGERKATGSYYTPEDVVDYIVRNTVGEKLSELKSEFYEEHDIRRSA
ncbi:MAG: hypothetical protein L6435_01720, partial [Anaerolineae bacterium]|nr:hypothetical protein [Anaerolineae bacterium]